MEEDQGGSRLRRGEGRRPDLSGIVVLTEAESLLLTKTCAKTPLPQKCPSQRHYFKQVVYFILNSWRQGPGKRVFHALAES